MGYSSLQFCSEYRSIFYGESRCYGGPGKSIDSLCLAIVKRAHLFYDMIHVKESLTTRLGTDKTQLYGCTKQKFMPLQRIQQTEARPNIKGFRQNIWVSSRKTFLIELTKSSGILQRQVRGQNRRYYLLFEMLFNQLNLRRCYCVQQIAKKTVIRPQNEAFNCSEPVPPKVKEQITSLITKAHAYQDSVYFTPHNDIKEANFSGRNDASLKRRVVLSTTSQRPPKCCAYSNKGDGFPC